MGTFDLTLGCLLIASWANMILFTLELQQYEIQIMSNADINLPRRIIKYFGRYKRDLMFNKIMVLIALAGDILGVFASLSMVYYYMVSHWGEVVRAALLAFQNSALTFAQAVLTTQPWTYPAFVVSIGITGGAVQIFLTRMAYTLTKQWFWIPIIGSFIMVAFAGVGLTAGHLIADSSLASREKLIPWATMWFSSSVATDTLITIVLVAKLQALKTGFSGTGGLIQRLTLAAVRNGLITTVMTLKLTARAPMVEIVTGRVYTLCMLSNLNNRSWGSNASSNSRVVSSQGTPTHHRTVDQAPGVVQVHREVEIRMDPLEYGKRKQGDAESLDDASATSYPPGKEANAAKYVTF
ncbi:hypothetical protein B0H16DRAFT_1728478 [Mycena metata]|uniref:DUF6534 domain-containing protein n=1 Tax=Mycena metata TaxID=1033252 RepID=A0AAD7N1L2_9AGAR|nr:hypothetical protein B0H16DRAFT_1728478 [Mycena metata]